MLKGRSRLPAVFMLMGSISSIQIGIAISTFLFDEVGVAGTVFLRSALAAVVLVLIWRPSPRIPQAQLRLVVFFGITLAAVSLAIYEAIDRIPLGTAITLEFIGPLAVALITSRRPRDLVWAGMAAVGIVLLTGGIQGGALDALGIVLALVAAFFWGAYIMLGTRLGVDSSGGSLLALAMVFATVLTLPPGVIGGGSDLLAPSVLAVGFVVGLLTAAIPFSLEFEAMRRLPSNVFGVMMSLQPAVAALIGFLVLGQHVSLVQAAAIALVVTASAGAIYTTGEPAQVEP